MALMVPLAWLALGMSVPLSGTVEDASGKPVAGATVWLGDTVATREGPQVIASAETDEQGRFRLERPEGLAGRGPIWSPTLWAYKPGSRLAFLEFKRELPRADEPVKLTLGPAASTTVRVVYPDGWAVHDAKVRPVQFKLKAPNPPDKLLDRLAVITDVDGLATVDGLSPADLFALDVTAEGAIVQCLAIDPDGKTITLRPTGTVRVKVVADDPAAVAGWKITVRPHPTEPGYQGPYYPHWSREVTGKDGRASFPPLAVGSIFWGVEPPEGSAYLAESPRGAAIKAGETTEVEIRLSKGARVEGVLREEPGGAPIPGVKVDVANLRAGSRTVHYLTTDAEGHYSGPVLPGTIRFSYSLHDMPAGYFLPPGTQHWVDFEVKAGEARHEFDPPRLRKAAQVRGMVVDEGGRPVAGANVTGHWTSAEFGRDPNSHFVRSDARGEFVLGSIAPGAEAKLGASTGPADESDPVVVASAGAGGSVTIRLRKKPTLALTGRVVEADGRPLAGARVSVEVRQPGQFGGRGSLFAFEGSPEIHTGPDGRFATPGQVPVGFQYRVAVEAPGHEPADSRWVAPPVLAIPDVPLRRAVGVREVAGRVVDSAGQPVAGVEVFQSGDGPRRTRGLTDAEGQFRVPGVPDAPAFLFASKPGYRLAYRRVGPGGGPAEIALRRQDEPPISHLSLAAPAVPRDEERAIARALLAEARESRVRPDLPESRNLPEVAAMLDPDRTLGLIEDQVIQADPPVLWALAVGLTESDPRRALEVLEAAEPPGRATTTALAFLDRMGSTLPIESRRAVLDLAARRARAIDEPGMAASQLARVADRWLDLGDRERGVPLAQEAEVMAAKPRPQQAFPNPPNEEVALALARVDLTVALRLLAGRSAQEQPQVNRALAGVAARVASTDPDGARRALALIPEEARPAATRAAGLRLASKDLPAARALLAGGPDPTPEAFLPAAAARGLVATDPAGARALLLEAVGRIDKLEDSPMRRPGPAVALARLLPLAARLDPDRAPGYLAMALAHRPPLSSLPEPMPVMPDTRRHYLDLAELAVRVARYDREAAEVVFAPVAARLVRMDDDHWGLGGEGPALFAVAGAFDARVARDLLEALPADPPAPEPGVFSNGFRHQSKAQARLALARSLALPPAIRLREAHQLEYGLDPNADFDD